jgi:amino acid transporter
MWIFYALITGSIFIYRRKFPHLERPYRVLGYPVVPIVFLLVAGWLLCVTLYTAFPEIKLGLNLIVSGFNPFSLQIILEGLWNLMSVGPIAGILLILAGLPVYWYFSKYGYRDDETTNDKEG